MTREDKVANIAPDRHNREAMNIINDLNDRFAAARYNLRTSETVNRQQFFDQPCIGLFPTNNNVWENIAITYGGEKVCNWNGIPNWHTCIEQVEKYINKKITYN